MLRMPMKGIPTDKERGHMSTQDDTYKAATEQRGVNGFSSVREILQALDERRISAVELLELHLQRIRRYNSTLNAVVVLDEEAARQSAVNADARRARGEQGALLGLPMTIKESIEVRGLPATAGVPMFAQRRPEKDARIVERVRAAGAVIMGKTNIPPFTGDWQADNPIYGRTNNPWDLSRSPGGSTGGGAAAVAAGLTPLELGSDIGGSIRIPAAFCGLYGHKPSETALPRSGHFPGSSLPNAATGMAVQGPLARTADDLQRAFGVVAGPDIGEDVAWQLHIPAPRHERLAEFRIAVLPAFSWLPVDAEIMAAQQQLVAGLIRSGARVQEIVPEGLGDLRHYYSVYLKLLFTLTNVGRSQEALARNAAEYRAQNDEFMTACADGMEASASDYIIWHARREIYREAWRVFFREWDVLLTPVNIVPAFPHTTESWFQRRLEINGESVLYARQSAYASIATLCGLPATAFPVGLTQAGLPIGLQAIGPYLEDSTPMRFAALVAQEFGGFRRPRGYDEA